MVCTALRHGMGIPSPAVLRDFPGRFDWRPDYAFGTGSATTTPVLGSTSDTRVLRR
jgi:hypothetical protein